MTLSDATEIVADLERLLPDWIDMEPARWQRVEYALRRSAGGKPVFPTFESFIEWVDEDTSAEWVEGEVVFMSPASTQHQLIAGFLYVAIRGFVEHHSLGTVLNAPFKIKLPGYGPEPDILFLATANMGRLRKAHLDGPADLIVEIVSPDSVERDRVKKYNAYEAAGVGEYWLIDPEYQSAEFYTLVNGPYELAGITDCVYTSRTLPGFQLTVDWLWRTPLPTLVETLRALGVL